MNREGRHQIGRSPVSIRSMHSYILTYSRLPKRETVIALDSHRGGGRGWDQWRGLEFLRPSYPHRRVGFPKAQHITEKQKKKKKKKKKKNAACLPNSPEESSDKRASFWTSTFR